jgi:glycosyltransferase involved in cell wall biosynthesis
MRLAFVAPRYGEDIVGGAESLVRDFATRLAARGHHIEVLTTCARDHYTWENVLPAGVSTENGVRLHRFPVTHPRDHVLMARLQRALDNGLELDPASQWEWVANTGESAPLLEGIDCVAGHVDSIVFAPYLFASTVQGARVHPERSVIIPCLHDESYARFDVIQGTLRAAAALVFNSEPEQELTQRLLGELPAHRVVGVGFDDPGRTDGDGFKTRRALTGDLVSFAGRREAGKNFPLLVEYIAMYGAALARNGPATLVAMGSGRVDPPPAARPFVVDLGFVTPEEKLDAISASVATALLSLNESFSYFLAEGWLCGVPAIVHADGAVTRRHCEDSGGGLWVRSAEEFAETLDRLRADRALRHALGESGRAWVHERYSWPAVLDRFEDAMSTLLA